ncbi:hypothetical protein LTR37_017501 [Vermiconidia calcicola]|uniref:Uncharacterized protein n=1 Tax=Vermiconidia calcicola TaxID=1690605 RepID=A0ACC3MJP8_9PEZI|nr:hypothetical protein LTR37_017501 [Vermiconidia calcicola]
MNSELQLHPSSMASETSPPALQPAANDDKPFRFLDLPGELRNEIYEMAFYHEENDGFIAPALVSSTADAWEERFPTYVNGQKKIIGVKTTVEKAKDEARTFYCEAGSGIDIEGYQRHLRAGGHLNDKVISVYEHGGDGKLKLSRCECAHVCSLECLRQPPITMASRQLRQEGLPMFYSLNKFRLGCLDGDDRIERAFISWWRHTGDTNLRLIDHFEIANLHEVGRDIWSKVEIRVIRDKAGSGYIVDLINPNNEVRQGVTFSRINGKLKFVVSEGERAKAAADSKHGIFMEYVGQLEDDGLFVRGIEKVVGSGQWLERIRVDWDYVKHRPEPEAVATDMEQVTERFQFW